MKDIKLKYRAFTPKTTDEAIDLMTTMHDEDVTDTDFMNGYRMGLRVGINCCETINKHKWRFWLK